MTDTPPGLDDFIAREHPRLVGTISLMLGDAAVAEEVVQEPLVAVASRCKRVSAMMATGAYAHRAAVNTATSWLRRRGAERRARARAGHEVDTVHHDPDTTDRLTVRAALGDLPLPQREAIVLQLSVDETAQHMGRTNQAVRNLTHRAIGQLREALDVDLDVEEPADAH